MKKTIKTIMIAAAISGSAMVSANDHIGEFYLGNSTADMSYFGNSLNKDSNAFNLGVRGYILDNYSVFVEYSNMSKDSERMEVGFDYIRSLNERVSITSGISYSSYEGDFVTALEDKVNSLNLRVGTEVKLNREVSFEIGLERSDVDYKFDGLEDEREIDVKYYSKVRYDFNPHISVSVNYRDLYKELGFKVSWLF